MKANTEVKYFAYLTCPRKGIRRTCVFNNLEWFKNVLRTWGDYNIVLHELPEGTTKYAFKELSMKHNYPDSDEFIANPTKQQTDEEYVAYSLRKRYGKYNLLSPFETRAPLEQLRAPQNKNTLTPAPVEPEPAEVKPTMRIKKSNLDLDAIMAKLKQERKDVHAVLAAAKE